MLHSDRSIFLNSSHPNDNDFWALVYKGKHPFLILESNGRVFANPALATIINSHDLLIWDQLINNHEQKRMETFNKVLLILKNKQFNCTVYKEKLFTTLISYPITIN